MGKRVLVTGAAGFIGFHVSRRLLDLGDEVVGLDNVNSYYDPSLKEARLSQLLEKKNFQFYRGGLEDHDLVLELFARHSFDRVIHLAAQAGVRYSIENPRAYIDSNIDGFLSILEACRHHGTGHLVYASSSSVYGANTKVPFSVEDNVDHPISLYAATKKANELMAHTYSHLFGIPTSGLRFFTVYGPWGRPDMALYIFTKAIVEGRPIKVFNYGRMQRDFTYIDDIVEGILRVCENIPQASDGNTPVTSSPARSNAPYRVYNIGNNRPVELMYVIEQLEKLLGREAKKEMIKIQPGDVPLTYADIDDLKREIGFRPMTTIEVGLERFVRWFRSYHNA